MSPLLHLQTKKVLTHSLFTVTMTEIHSSFVLLDRAETAVFPLPIHLPQHFQESTLPVTSRIALDTEIFWTLHLGEEMGEYVTEVCNLTYFKQPAPREELPHFLITWLTGSSSFQNVPAQGTGAVDAQPCLGKPRVSQHSQLAPGALTAVPGLSLARQSQRTRIRDADFLPDEVMCCNMNVPPPSQLHRDRRGPQKLLMCLLVTERNECWQSHFCLHMYRSSKFSTSPFHSTLLQSASFSSPLHFI